MTATCPRCDAEGAHETVTSTAINWLRCRSCSFVWRASRLTTPAPSLGSWVDDPEEGTRPTHAALSETDLDIELKKVYAALNLADRMEAPVSPSSDSIQIPDVVESRPSPARDNVIDFEAWLRNSRETRSPSVEE